MLGMFTAVTVPRPARLGPCLLQQNLETPLAVASWRASAGTREGQGVRRVGGKRQREDKAHNSVVIPRSRYKQHASGKTDSD